MIHDLKDVVMKQRFTLFLRSGVYYIEDTNTGKQSSLRTRNPAEANTLLHARNEATRQPDLNLQIARTYMTASDPALSARAWQHVMQQIAYPTLPDRRYGGQCGCPDRQFYPAGKFND